MGELKGENRIPWLNLAKISTAAGIAAVALHYSNEINKPSGQQESQGAVPTATEPACPTPTKHEMRVIERMFTPVRRPRWINTGLVAQENGLVSYDNLDVGNTLDFQPHDTVAGLRKYIAEANVFLKPYGLHVRAGTQTKDYAKDGWRAPTAKELMGETSSNNIENLVWQLGELPTDYLKLSGIQNINLMYNQNGPQGEVGSARTVLFNIANDSLTSTHPFALNELIYRYIDWKEGCGTKDPALNSINGRKIYYPHHHRGLVPRDSYAGNLIGFWDYKKDLAAKAGKAGEYRRLEDKIRKENERMAVVTEDGFSSPWEDKGEVAVALTSENLLGAGLDPSRPILRKKLLLELARLQKLKIGARPVGKQVVKYFAAIANYPKPEKFH